MRRPRFLLQRAQGVDPHPLIADEQIAHAEDEHGRRSGQWGFNVRLRQAVQGGGVLAGWRGGWGESGNQDRPTPFSISGCTNFQPPTIDDITPCPST